MTVFVRPGVDGRTHVVGVDDGQVNALTLGLIDELSTAISEVPPDAALVIAGRAGCLTAGLDRRAMLSGDREAVSSSLRRVTELYEQILQHPAPTVVACTGHALAAGALLLLIADARVGARVPCKIGFNEAQIGLPLAPLAVAAARARLAPQAVLRATLHGAVYDAGPAVDVGFLDEITDAEAVVDLAVDRAGRLAKLDRRAYLRTRELIWAAVRAEVSAALTQRRERPTASFDTWRGKGRER